MPAYHHLKEDETIKVRSTTHSSKISGVAKIPSQMGMKDTAGSADDVHVEEGGVGGTDDANIEVQEGDFGSMPPPPHPSLDGDDTPTSISQSSPTHGNKQHSMLRSRSVMRASRPTVKECLHTPDEEMYDLTLDVYNMFFLSDIGSQAFFYTFAVLFTKMSLYTLLLVDLRDNKKLPFEQNVDAALIVSGTLYCSFVLHCISSFKD